MVPPEESGVTRTRLTDPAGQAYELQLMEGSTLRDPDRPPSTDLVSRLGRRIARRFLNSAAGVPKDVQTFTVRVALVFGKERALLCTLFVDAENLGGQVARITDAVTTGTFDPEQVGA